MTAKVIVSFSRGMFPLIVYFELVLSSVLRIHLTKISIVQSYSAREALGQFMMKDLENGAYAKESYVAHIGMCRLSIHSMDDLIRMFRYSRG
jgi:hypothetical protein